MMPAMSMPRLSFRVEDARPEAYAQAPTMAFGIRIVERDDAEVESIALGCQVRIEPQRRRYQEEEQALLADLFGDPGRWGQTVRPFLLAQVSTLVPRFVGSCRAELAIPFSYDLEVASARYLHALGDGSVPLIFLFSGTVFRAGAEGLQASPIPWECEARFDLPVATWRGLMDAYFPGGGWLRLGRETLDGLTRYKARRGLLGWDEVVADLLERAGS
jgi:hypothetical protein